MIRVRPAGPADAAAMSHVLIASITKLCGADHGGDPAAIAAWLANKTPAAVAAMLAAPAARFFVAEVERSVAAVGCILGEHEVGLNYVDPAHRFRGVSRALLAAMEAALGPGEAHLDSTVTAHRFYLAAGWEDAGAPRRHFGMVSHPMRKLIVPTPTRT